MLAFPADPTDSTNPDLRRSHGGLHGRADAIVLGAGVVGITTAWALLDAGLSVCLVDRADGPARGTSFANGAQLSYAYTDALASPALLRKIPALALGLDPLFRLKPGTDLGLYSWLIAFLRNMTGARFERSTLAVLQLALESQQEMGALLSRHAMAFDHGVPGKMHLHYSGQALSAAERTMGVKRAMGVEQAILTRDEAIGLEPALAQVDGLEGVVHSPHDAVGDAHRFSEEMLALCAARDGFQSRFGFDVAGVERSDADAGCILPGQDGTTVSGSRLVLCGGAESAKLAQQLGLRLPIQPMKGYSFTARPGPDAPRVSLTDTKRKIVFCRLGDRMRVAGLADLGVRSAEIDPARIAVLRRLAEEAMPGAIAPGSVEAEWAGLRPMTPNSAPIIRWVDAGLGLNVGHGMLGWTLALGSARRLARALPGSPC